MRTHPYVTNVERVGIRWFFGSRLAMLASGEASGGSLAVHEQTLMPGAATPWHRHAHEDEAFYVLEGRLHVIVGEEREGFEAGPGSFVFGPRGVAHGYRAIGEEPVRLLTITAPSGFDAFVMEVSEPATAPGFGPMPDPALVETSAERHGIAILGPLPNAPR